MAVGFDELVERLLYDVALAGTGGESARQCAAFSKAIETHCPTCD